MAGRATKSAGKITCPCCKKLRHPKTVQKHMTGSAPATYLASRAAEAAPDMDRTWDLQADARPVKRFRTHRSPSGGEASVPAFERDPSDRVPGPSASHDTGLPNADPPLPVPETENGGATPPVPIDEHDQEEEDERTMDLGADLPSVHTEADVWAGRTRYRQPFVEDELDEDVATGARSDEEDDTVEIDYSLEDKEAEYEAISVWDELIESLIREGIITGTFYALASCTNSTNLI